MLHNKLGWFRANKTGALNPLKDNEETGRSCDDYKSTQVWTWQETLNTSFFIYFFLLKNTIYSIKIQKTRVSDLYFINSTVTWHEFPQNSELSKQKPSIIYDFYI